MAIAGVLTVIAVIVAACSEASSPAVEIERLPAEVQADYRFISGQRELAGRLPCYCGCGETLGHGNLYDCFVGPGGYAAHAAGCAVCQNEAREARDLLAAGEDVAGIRARIDADFRAFGRPTNTP